MAILYLFLLALLTFEQCNRAHASASTGPLLQTVLDSSSAIKKFQQIVENVVREKMSRKNRYEHAQQNVVEDFIDSKYNLIYPFFIANDGVTGVFEGFTDMTVALKDEFFVKFIEDFVTATLRDNAFIILRNTDDRLMVVAGDYQYASAYVKIIDQKISSIDFRTLHSTAGIMSTSREKNTHVSLTFSSCQYATNAFDWKQLKDSRVDSVTIEGSGLKPDSDFSINFSDLVGTDLTRIHISLRMIRPRVSFDRIAETNLQSVNLNFHQSHADFSLGTLSIQPFKASKVEFLTLEYCGITALDLKDLKNTEISILKLKGNEITTFDGSLAGTKVFKVDLSSNRLSGQLDLSGVFESMSFSNINLNGNPGLTSISVREDVCGELKVTQTNDAWHIYCRTRQSLFTMQIEPDQFFKRGEKSIWNFRHSMLTPAK